MSNNKMISVPLQLSEQQSEDLLRFNDTSEDGQCYDVSAESMKALVRAGLVHSIGVSRYLLTGVGVAVVRTLRAPAPQSAQQRPGADEPEVIGYRVRWEQNPSMEELLYKDPDGDCISDALILQADHQAALAAVQVQHQDELDRRGMAAEVHLMRRDAQGVDWPNLDKPAKVGAGRFSAGVSARLVVEAAQRHYDYEVTPEKEAERIARAPGLLAQLLTPTSECVACHVDREIPSVAHGGSDAKAYRLLTDGELIQASDEYLDDDASTWLLVKPSIFVGMAYSRGGLLPVRRAVSELTSPEKSS